MSQQENNLKKYHEIPIAGVVPVSDAEHPKTGGWRTELKPQVNLDKCINCLLCWVDCPDTAILIDGEDFFGFDYDYCKGCELCEEVCPVDAIEMVQEETDVPEFGRIGGPEQ